MALELLKALSDGTRFRAWAALQEQELCACQLIELLQLAPSTVSRHLTILRQAGLVESRKDGRWIYYRKADLLDEAMQGVLAGLLDSQRRSSVLTEDRRLLKGILAVSPEELCRKQCV